MNNTYHGPFKKMGLHFTLVILHFMVILKLEIVFHLCHFREREFSILLRHRVILKH